MTKYCIDASALIDLGERHYPERLKLFEPIWASLYDGIDNGNIISVDYVKMELERKADDWRNDFLIRADQMFQINEDVEHEYASVISDIESLPDLPMNKARDRFLSGADPWVIALARSMDDCAAISAERKPLNAYGLGALCSELGVRHLNLVDFFEENGIGR